MHFLTAKKKRALDNAIITPFNTSDNIVFDSLIVVVVVFVEVMEGVVVIN
jgi:hypothetical protein